MGVCITQLDPSKAVREGGIAQKWAFLTPEVKRCEGKDETLEVVGPGFKGWSSHLSAL